jgi:hypothetical protein
MYTIHTTRLLVGMAGLACAAAFGPVAFAQTDSTPASRTEVKQETRAANKSGQLLPAGEVNAADKQKPAASTKTRAQRKAETLEAAKKGDLQSPGQSLYKTHMSQQKAMANSTKTRAERKAETRQAAKEGKLPPAGEGEAGKK